MYVYTEARGVRKLKAGCTLETYQTRHPTAIRVGKPPSFSKLEEWHYDSGCETVKCGCWVEPDGHCRHGMPSWLLALGLI